MKPRKPDSYQPEVPKGFIILFTLPTVIRYIITIVHRSYSLKDDTYYYYYPYGFQPAHVGVVWMWMWIQDVGSVCWMMLDTMVTVGGVIVIVL